MSIAPLSQSPQPDISVPGSAPDSIDSVIVLVTNNRKSMPRHLADHLASGRHIMHFVEKEIFRRRHATAVLFTAAFVFSVVIPQASLLSQETRAELEAKLDPTMDYVSRVGQDLIVNLSEGEIWAGILILSALLIGSGFVLAPRPISGG